ncbi:MAG TPA: flavin reductase family protein [Anaeromyxobacteraceae bacterium]
MTFPGAPMDKDAFTQVLQKFPLPVTVVTVGRGGAENALTVSWVCPASFDPPQIMFAADLHHYSVDFLRSTKNFAVNVLREGQTRLAAHFSRQSMAHEDKLAAATTREGDSGAAILTDALSYLDCEVAALYETGDHVIVVGNVVDAGVLNEGAPLTTAAGLRYTKAGPGR